MREQSQVLAKMHVQSDLLNKLAESTLLETDASLINARNCTMDRVRHFHCCLVNFAPYLPPCLLWRSGPVGRAPSTSKKTSRAKSAAQTIARRGSGMSGRLPAVRGPLAPTLLYPHAERPRQRLG